MLMIEKVDTGILIKISGDSSLILTELSVLVEAVQEEVEGTDVREALNDPIQRCLTSAYLKAMRRPKSAKEKEPERKADSTEGKE